MGFSSMSMQTCKRFVKARVPFVYSSYLKAVDVFHSRIFAKIYREDSWTHTSGSGSTLEQTETIRREIPALIAKYQIRTVLDIPCGNHAWMSQVNLDGCHYIGADIVRDLILQNRIRYGSANKEFVCLNLAADRLPSVDSIICRDCLVHFSFRLIRKALRNIKASRSKYLLTTTFPAHERNRDIKTGGWRPLNFRASPFNFPEPELMLNEGCNEWGGIYEDKSLGLWRVSDIPDL
jgi:hypothetical protein